VDVAYEKSIQRDSRHDAFVDTVGPIASALKKNLLLPGTVLVSAVVVVLATTFFSDRGEVAAAWTPWLGWLGVAAAVAVGLDKVADAYDTRRADLEFLGSERTAEASVSDLNAFLIEAIETTFLQGVSRVSALRALRRALVQFACKSIGPGTRATYYTLEPHEPGRRVLGDPQHAVALGRKDKPARPFVEEQDPHHDVWQVLDGADERPDVRRRPDVVADLEWDERPYDSFVSIPVKARGVEFGLLSVNNTNAESIGEAQRAVIVAMARVMGLALAFDIGSQAMAAREVRPLMSAAADSVSQTDEKGDVDGHLHQR
jgi:hypothetical protein